MNGRSEIAVTVLFALGHFWRRLRQNPPTSPIGAGALRGLALLHVERHAWATSGFDRDGLAALIVTRGLGIVFNG